MSFNGKMVFAWLIVLWMLWRINAKARKYRANPTEMVLQQRNDWCLKRVNFVLKLYGVKVKVEGYENLPKGGAILTPNHKSNLDAFILLKALAKPKNEVDPSVLNKVPTFVAKIELKKKRVVRNALSLLDTFYVDREDFRQAFKTMDEFGQYVKENKTYGVVFPEGKRVDEEPLAEFKAGAFKTAASIYVPIVPVAISDTRTADDKKRSKKLEVIVKFLPPIKPNAFLSMQPQAIAEKVKNQIEGALNASKE